MRNAPLVQYRNFFYDSTRWEGFRFRPGDIVISTPPKCGTTWTQRICALLILQTPHLEKPLTTYSPWIDVLTTPIAEVLGDLEAQTHRRFIKTHTPFDGLPFDERVTYVCVGRDPRDVALSWYGHVENTDFESVVVRRGAVVGSEDIADLPEQGLPVLPDTDRERFWLWVDDPTPATGAACSLVATLHHLGSFWKERHRPNVVMLHYSDLKADLEGEMRRLAARLGIDVPESRWPDLVKAATFDEMKREAHKTAPGVTEEFWQDNSRFFRRGALGEWKAVFEPGDDARYAAHVRELADDDLAAWVHQGGQPD